MTIENKITAVFSSRTPSYNDFESWRWSNSFENWLRNDWAFDLGLTLAECKIINEMTFSQQDKDFIEVIRAINAAPSVECLTSKVPFIRDCKLFLLRNKSPLYLIDVV